MPVQLIKSFEPEDEDDCSKTRKHKAHWCSEDGTTEGYYPAFVHALVGIAHGKAEKEAEASARALHGNRAESMCAENFSVGHQFPLEDLGALEKTNQATSTPSLNEGVSAETAESAHAPMMRIEAGVEATSMAGALSLSAPLAVAVYLQGRHAQVGCFLLLMDRKGLDNHLQAHRRRAAAQQASSANQPASPTSCDDSNVDSPISSTTTSPASSKVPTPASTPAPGVQTVAVACEPSDGNNSESVRKSTGARPKDRRPLPPGLLSDSESEEEPAFCGGSSSIAPSDGALFQGSQRSMDEESDIVEHTRVPAT
ncbi:hypothetical protein HPB49_017988 [Dermacentor silvarum]|uniref:Uncharacterized protein n=1 Tax=Dermacentor silvarum TaxID=543639 RepID=A0ACB8C4Q5_DERSI|nr:hypothetical protein HPB49_017988 [Dermacentor silvarum]